VPPSSLAKNGLQDVTAVGQALRVNRSLQKLDLHGNTIRDASSIFSALEDNNTLEEL
jgi:hypothetical protein